MSVQMYTIVQSNGHKRISVDEDLYLDNKTNKRQKLDSSTKNKRKSFTKQKSSFILDNPEIQQKFLSFLENNLDLLLSNTAKTIDTINGIYKNTADEDIQYTSKLMSFKQEIQSQKSEIMCILKEIKSSVLTLQTTDLITLALTMIETIDSAEIDLGKALDTQVSIAINHGFINYYRHFTRILFKRFSSIRNALIDNLTNQYSITTTNLDEPIIIIPVAKPVSRSSTVNQKDEDEEEEEEEEEEKCTPKRLLNKSIIKNLYKTSNFTKISLKYLESNLKIDYKNEIERDFLLNITYFIEELFNLRKMYEKSILLINHNGEKSSSVLKKESDKLEKTMDKWLQEWINVMDKREIKLRELTNSIITGINDNHELKSYINHRIIHILDLLRKMINLLRI